MKLKPLALETVLKTRATIAANNNDGSCAFD
jgi:hypothetical protein